MQPPIPTPPRLITEPAHIQSPDQTLSLTIAPLGEREPCPEHGEAGSDLVQLRVHHTPAPQTSAELARMEGCQKVRHLWDIYSNAPIAVERHEPDSERHRLGIAAAATLSGLGAWGLGLQLGSRDGACRVLIPPRANPRRLWVLFHTAALAGGQERWEVYEITSARALWLCAVEEPSP